MTETERETFRSFTHDPSDSNSLSSNLIQSLYVDAKGIIWIGTFGGGLNKFDPVSEKFQHFNESNSNLSNNVIYGVLGDDKGFIWVSSNRGLSKLDPETGQFKNYNDKDGLQSKEFNGQSCFKSRDGELFLAGSGVLIHFILIV